MVIERGVINAVVGLTIAVVISVIGAAYYSINLSLPDLNLTCHFPKLIGSEVEMDPELYRLPKRNPFFYPRPDISVALNVASNKTEVTKQNPKADIIYKGMVIWGEDKIAIVFLPKEKKTQFVKLGDFIEGYKILDITEDTVVLSKQEGLSIITLKLGGLSEKCEK